MNQLNKEKTSYLKYILNIRRSKFAYILLFCATFAKIIWTLRDKFPQLSLLNIDINLLITQSINSLDPTKLKIINISSIFWSLLIISIFELTKSGNIKTLSLSRVKFSEGGKYSDLIYFLIMIFEDRVKYLAILATLGFYKISDTFRLFLDTTYEKLIPINLFSNNLSIFCLFIVGLLMLEFCEFFGHWLSHKFFWEEMHELHHSATEMTILSGSRNCILEKTIQRILRAPVDILAILIINQSVQQGTWSVFLFWSFYQLCKEFFNFLGHSSCKFIFPKPFSYVFLSPSLHWIHHSDNPKHFNKNLGTVFTFWDRVFGTYLDETHLKDVTGFGVKNNEWNKHNPLYCYYIMPLKRTYRKGKRILGIS